MDEVRDVAPPTPVMVPQCYATLEHLFLGLYPKVGKSLRTEFPPFTALRMDRMLEPVHSNLPEYGGDCIVYFTHQHGEPIGGVLLLRKHSPEHDHLAEDRGGLGSGQWRIGLQDPLPPRQILVYAVAKFVRQRLHIARSSRKVQEDVRVSTRHGAVTKGASLFTGSRRGVNPMAVEEKLCDGSHPGMERVVGRTHDVAGFFPGILSIGFANRGVPVIVEQLVVPEQIAFQAIKRAARPYFEVTASISASTVSAVLRWTDSARTARRIATKSIVQRLVRKDRIENAGECAAVCYKPLRKGQSSLLAQGAIRFVQYGQHFLLGFFLSVYTGNAWRQAVRRRNGSRLHVRLQPSRPIFFLRLSEQVIPL